jgi:hypothetical protein
MSNKITRYALIQAVDTTKYLQIVSIDVRMDFVETANNVEGYHSGVADKITNALSSLFNEQNITVHLMTEDEYSQMINNEQ